jgi:hypothetical protein
MSDVKEQLQREDAVSRGVLAWIVAAIAAVCIVALLDALAGCATVATPVDVATYASEESQCVTLAGTRAAADLCVAGVRANWCSPGKPLAEAGACNYVVDAGGQ